MLLDRLLLRCVTCFFTAMSPVFFPNTSQLHYTFLRSVLQEQSSFSTTLCVNVLVGKPRET